MLRSAPEIRTEAGPVDERHDSKLGALRSL